MGLMDELLPYLPSGGRDPLGAPRGYTAMRYPEVYPDLAAEQRTSPLDFWSRLGIGADMQGQARRMQGTAPPVGLPGGGGREANFAPGAGSEPQTWGQAFESRLLGTQAQGLGQDARRDASMNGLMQAALALDGPGGFRNNWGRAMLAGIAGARGGVQAGLGQQRMDRYRQSLEEQLRTEQDPNRRLELEHMILNPEKFIQADQAARGPVHWGKRTSPDGTKEIDVFTTIGPDGRPVDIEYGGWRQINKDQADAMDPEKKQKLVNEIKGAREQVEAMDEMEREGLAIMNPVLYRLATQSYPGESEASHRAYIRKNWKKKPEEPAPDGGPGVIDQVGDKLSGWYQRWTAPDPTAELERDYGQ